MKHVLPRFYMPVNPMRLFLPVRSSRAESGCSMSSSGPFSSAIYYISSGKLLSWLVNWAFFFRFGFGS